MLVETLIQNTLETHTFARRTIYIKVDYLIYTVDLARKYFPVVNLPDTITS